MADPLLRSLDCCYTLINIVSIAVGALFQNNENFPVNTIFAGLIRMSLMFFAYLGADFSGTLFAP
jgi:hypothetical protein